MRRLLLIPGHGRVVDPDQTPPRSQEEEAQRVRAYMESHGMLPPSPQPTAESASAQTADSDAGMTAPQSDTPTGEVALPTTQLQEMQQVDQFAHLIEEQHQRTEALLEQQARETAHAAEMAQRAAESLRHQQQHEAQLEALEQQQFAAQQAMRNAQDAQK